MNAEVSLLGPSDTTQILSSIDLKTTSGDSIEFSIWSGGTLGALAIIGENEPNPLEAARRVHKHDKLSSILIFSPTSLTANIKEQLITCPHIGLDTQVLPTHDMDLLATNVINHVELGLKRRRHQQQISGAHHTLASSSSYQPQSPLILNQLLGQLPIGVMTVTPTCRLLNLNPAAERMLDQSTEEVLGRPLAELFTSQSSNINLSLIAEALATGNTTRRILKYFRNDQALFYEIVACRADPKSPKRGALILLEDVTQRVLAEKNKDQLQKLLTDSNQSLEARVNERTMELANAQRDLKQRNTQLTRSNEDLEKFSYIAAHDLGEPLRKISIFADLLDARASETLDDKARQYLVTMKNSSLRLHALIESLLAYSRINAANKLPSPTNLNTVLEQVQKDLEISITENGAAIEAGVLPTLEADPIQMQQVFQNLMSNSLRYKRSDLLPVITVTARADQSESFCEIVFADNGLGFDPQYSEKVFQPFERLHSTEGLKGSGIGLAICYQVCARHGGSIRVESQPNEGATFILRLPYSQASVNTSNELHALPANDA